MANKHTPFAFEPHSLERDHKVTGGAIAVIVILIIAALAYAGICINGA